MLRLVIGNKAYSSWSLRGWLAVRQSGLPFEEVVVPLYDAQWDERRKAPDLAPSSGKVPILWDDDGTVVWDSLAIVEWLADRAGRERFWPRDDAERGLARSIAAEMHAGFAALRGECPMNIRRRFAGHRPSAAVEADLARIYALWSQARARRGADGDFLFGGFGAADIMFAPVCARIASYDLPRPRFAEPYLQAVFAHPFMQDWIAGAQAEEWVIARYEASSQAG